MTEPPYQVDGIFIKELSLEVKGKREKYS